MVLEYNEGLTLVLTASGDGEDDGGSFGVERMNLMLLWYFLPSTFGLVRSGEFALEACGLEPQGGGGRWSLAGETGQR